MSTKAGRQRILVAMSGGVDSSVAAAMLVEAGYEVIGATMKTFCYGDDDAAASTRTCCGLDGIQDAGTVADRLGIPHHVFDVEREFTRDVVDDFVSEYGRGRTPNPCVRCNSNTKFRDLFRRGRVLGCDGVASGHYVRLDRSGAEPRMLRGVDAAKDQSYFLWGLPQELLGRLHFPLGGLTKDEVRARAREMGLSTADKPESQEICFVPTGDYRDFLAKKLLPVHPALSPGAIVAHDGRVLGRHDGYSGFTVGQRKGIGGGLPEPYYVLEIRPESREVLVGPRHFLDVDGVVVGDLNWLTAAPVPGAQMHVQIRYRSPLVPCRIESCGDDSLRLSFDRATGAVTPGQSSVFFDGDRVVGGGRIRRVTTSSRPILRTPGSVPAAPRSAIREPPPSSRRTDRPAALHGRSPDPGS